MAVALAAGAVALAQTLPQQTQPEEKALSPDGNQYVPYESRTGNESIVYFTRDLSAEGLIKAYEQVCADMTGSVGVKLHTGEPNGPNIIPREWVKELIENELPEAHIIETNTYYKGDRYTTEQHRQTLQINGWTFCPVDIIDEEDTLTLPVKGGKWFDKMSVGSHLTRYNSLLTLTHFKGHTGRIWRQQQKHRHRLCRRTHRQGMDTYHPGTRQPMGYCQRGVYGTHDGIDKIGDRLFRQTCNVYQRHAQHVCFVRLRRHTCRTRSNS